MRVHIIKPQSDTHLNNLVVQLGNYTKTDKLSYDVWLGWE